MTHSGPQPDREDVEGGQEKREMGFSHSPFHVDEIILQRLLRDGTLANLQLGSGIIMNIVDAHLVANGEAAQSGILIGQRIIIAGGHQSVALQRSRSLPEERTRECERSRFTYRQHAWLVVQGAHLLEMIRVEIIAIHLTQLLFPTKMTCQHTHTP